MIRFVKLTGFIFISFLFCSVLKSQIITSEPEFPGPDDEVRIIFNLQEATGTIAGYSGDLYAHTGVLTTESNDDTEWKYVIAGWTENIPEAKLSSLGNDLYELWITPNVRSFYGIPQDTDITHLAFVFRNPDGTRQTIPNLFIPLYENGLHIDFNIEDMESFLMSDTLNFNINIQNINTDAADSSLLYIDNIPAKNAKGNQINYQWIPSETGIKWIKVQTYNSELIESDSLRIYIRKENIVEALPDGSEDGIQYINDSTVTLVLYAPGKEYIFVTGDFNDWEISNDYLMNTSPDGKRFWLNIGNLTPGKEYMFQYFIDGEIRVADPYTDKIIDPINDQYISSLTYPNLIKYPEGKTSGIVSVLQTAQDEYPWEVEDFNPPPVENLVVYELFVRDFVNDHRLKTIADSLDYLKNLGINAIELMPVNEFEGNVSWGYNPSFYFAPDKYYGTKKDLKYFVDECHKRGIAVILDIVLNHSFRQSPLVQMYMNPNTYVVTEDNPWYNQTCPHYPSCWGYDFNHESEATQYFIDRVNDYWLSEYNIDGYRFDAAKHFTNKTGEGSPYDASRIILLKRMYDKIKEKHPDAILILEYFTENNDRKEVADYGYLIWEKFTEKYNEATMGYNESGKSDFSNISYKRLGWNEPHLLGYMESHDEERLMYKNLTWGNSTLGYNVKELHTALKRMEAAAAFFFAVPGPKMIWMFGELGYDISKYRCEDGQIRENDDCKLSPKPIKWDYLDEPQRRRLYQVFGSLIQLKQDYEVFRTEDFNISLTGSLKRINLNHSSMNVTIIGNFDVVEGKIDPGFQHTGTWYNYFSGDSVQINDVNKLISLKPGEYRLYTDEKLEKPDIIASVYFPEKEIIDFNVYPNPSTNLFAIDITVAKKDSYSLEVINQLGICVNKIHSGMLHPGKHHFYWNSNNQAGVGNEKGFYVLKITTNKQVYTKKLIRF